MSTQPKPIGVRALRLARELDAGSGYGADPRLIADSAAELRLLHTEIQRCQSVCDTTAEGWRTDAEEWKAERDALLGALKELTGGANKRFSGGEWDRARSAIKAMEEKT